MREIKFRGQRLDNGKWIYGSLVVTKFKEDKTERYFITQFLGNYTFDHEVVPETVGQFTGLLDKNGKEIYEGDIIMQENYNPYNYVAIYEVVYDGESFCLKMHKGNEKTMSNDSLCSFGWYENNKLRKGKIIGNIHDNPELITEN
jgi:uncharacterized phage protein (TIGR01671 family)